MIRGAVLTTLLTLLPLAAHAQYEATPTATPISESGAATPAPTPAAIQLSTGATKLKLGGTFYAFYRYDLSKGAHDINNFDVSRAYINVEPSWGDDFYARVTTDVVRATTTSAGNASVNTTGSEVIRLKYAYLGYHVHPMVDLKIGMQQTPFVSWEEDLWGYRVLSPVAAEQYGMSSSDFGWSATIKPHKMVEVHLGAYNGETYQKPETNKYKDFEGRVTVSPFACGDQPGLKLTGFYQYGLKTGDVQRTRAIGMVSWQDRYVTAGAEYLYAQDGLAAGGSVTGGGPTVFVNFTIPGVKPPKGKDIRLLARVDVIDPNKGKNKDGATRIIAGIASRATDKVQFVADYQQTDPETPGAVTAQALFLHWEAKF